MESRKYGAHTKEELSVAQYNGLIGAILFYGFVVNYLVIQNFTEAFLAWNLGLLLISYLVLSIIGIFISKISDSFVVSFIGYNFIVVPAGAVLSICLAGVSPNLIKNVILVTASVTVVMMATSTLFPKVFRSMGGTLLIALSAAVVVELLCVLMFKMNMPTIWEIIVALIFCCYIGYDWAIAQNKPYTANNAIDTCIDLYLDIVNLFLRTLSIAESRDRD